ncbi:MAG: hypothetical protein ACTSQO_12160 [Candidatus Helarchaeota archaeon]
MPELLAFTANLMLLKNLDKVALITDGRFSGATSGSCIGHISLEAYSGGPIAIAQNNDDIKIDIPNKKLDIDLSNSEIQSRLKNWSPPPKPVKSKTLLKYRKLVSPANKGAVLQY